MKKLKVDINNERLNKRQKKKSKKQLISEISKVIDPEIILIKNPFITNILKYKIAEIIKGLTLEKSKMESQNESNLIKVFNNYLKNNTVGGIYGNKYDMERYSGSINFDLLFNVIKCLPKFKLKNARIITKRYNELTVGRKLKYNTIRLGIKYLGFSYCRRRKVDISALNHKNIEKRLIFANEMNKFIQNEFTIINIDETCLSRKMRNCKDWILKTEKITYNNDRQLKSLSGILAVSTKGFRFSIVYESTINREIFRSFLFELKKEIESDNFLNTQLSSKKIVFLLDNSSVHKDVETLKEFTEFGFYFLFNVPYSPRYVFIEEFFSYVKRKMLYDSINTIEKRKTSYYRHVKDLCQYKVQGFFKHSLSTIINDIDNLS